MNKVLKLKKRVGFPFPTIVYPIKINHSDHTQHSLKQHTLTSIFYITTTESSESDQRQYIPSKAALKALSELRQVITNFRPLEKQEKANECEEVKEMRWQDYVWVQRKVKDTDVGEL